MIEKLTKDQTERMSEYTEKFIKAGLDTSRVSMHQAREIVMAIYDNVKQKRPERVYLVDSPLAAIMLYAELEKKEVKQCVGQINNFVWGAHEAGWLSYYAYMKDVLKVQWMDLFDKYAQVIHLGWCLFYENVAIVSQKPIYIRSENDVLHCENGPALMYADGFRLYRYKGIDMTNHIYAIEEPDTITVEKITSESNQEVKRALLEIFGYERFIAESGANLIHKDDFRGSPVELYSLTIDSVQVDGCLVVNSTAEPDGHFKKYFIQVEPGKYKTAVGALASTFVRKNGKPLTEAEYRQIEFES